MNAFHNIRQDLWYYRGTEDRLGYDPGRRGRMRHPIPSPVVNGIWFMFYLLRDLAP